MQPDQAQHLSTVARGLEQLAQGTTTGLALKDERGRYRWANTAYRALHHLGDRTIEGLTDAELIDHRTATERAALERRAVRSGASQPFIGTGAPALEGRIVPLEDGVAIACQVPAPADGLAPLRSLRELAEPPAARRVGSWDFDLRADTVEWDAAACEIYGHPTDHRHVDMRLIWAQQPPDVEVVRREVDECVNTGRPFSFVHRITRLDGSLRLIHTHGALIRDAAGAPERIRGWDEDVTEALASREDMARLYAFYARILESVDDPVCVVDTKGVVAFANTAATHQLDPAERGLVGRRLEDWLSDDRARDLLGRSLREGRREAIIALVGPEDGPRQLMELRCAAIREEGDRSGAVVTFRSVTDERERERQLQLGLASLQVANLERGRLLRALVDAQELERRRIATEIHDDPVQVMGAAALRVERALATVHDAAEREVLTELHDSVRAAVGRLRHLLFSLSPPSIDAGIAPAIECYAAQVAGQEGWHLQVDDHVDREPPMETRLVLYRIAQEALGNAARHAQATRVVIRVSTQGRSVRLRIEDDGVGFDPEQHVPVRGHLGLAGMRHRAEVAGGQCRVEPGAQRGTVVSVWLPMNEKDPSEEAPAP